MWLCIFLGKQFEDTFENTQWRKIKQMQKVWLFILLCKQFEDTFENAQWRKVKQMQPVWLCIISGRFFEETHENAFQILKFNYCNLRRTTGKPAYLFDKIHEVLIFSLKSFHCRQSFSDMFCFNREFLLVNSKCLKSAVKYGRKSEFAVVCNCSYSAF